MAIPIPIAIPIPMAIPIAGITIQEDSS